MFRIILFVFFLVEIAITDPVNAQQFGGGLKLAGTLSQIDGDDVYGFHKPGFEIGIYARTRLSKVTDLEIDFSYNQRGSQSTSSDPQAVEFNLHYIDIPVLFVVKDWLNVEKDKEYYHMHFFGGFSIGRLISSSSLGGLDKDFRKTDVSWILGATYFYAKNWGVTAKYTRSITSLTERAVANGQVNLISYFISLGLNYKFN